MTAQQHTPKLIWRPAFLRLLADTGNVRAACDAVGIPVQTAYKARKESPTFRQQWAEALQTACDDLEAVAFERARKGLSDILLMFLLRAHRPEVYREQRGVDVTTAGRPLDLASLLLSVDDDGGPPVVDVPAKLLLPDGDDRPA